MIIRSSAVLNLSHPVETLATTRSSLALWVALGSALLLTACPKPCTTTADCDDGLYCNGLETCGADKLCAAVPPNCDDSIACTVDSCSEEARNCQHKATDKDNDGYPDFFCRDARDMPLGLDCNDSNAQVNPGALEVCERLGTDEDCNTQTLGEVDLDRDGYESAQCFNLFADGGVAKRGTDCNDANEGVHPGSLEVCNGADENCNGMIDEGVLVSRYTDGDGDGWGAGASFMACITQPGTSHLGTDCDDTNPALHPGQFRCLPGGQGNEYALCLSDGGVLSSKCATRCIPQPNGTAVCN
jgi:Putative metal-binding motif